MPVVPDPSAPPISGPGITYSLVSALSTVTVTFEQWFLVVPEVLHLSTPLIRVPASATTGGGTTGGTTSWAATQNLEEAISRPFADPTLPNQPTPAAITHGAIQADELDISCAFRGEGTPPQSLDGVHMMPPIDAWEAVAARPDLTVLLQSDQKGRQWYVDLGAVRAPSVIRAADRRTNPLYVVSLHAISQPAP